MATVFLSYAQEDSAAVDVLSAGLRATGVETWLDRERLYAGQRWPKALGQAIAAADALILLWSRRSADSPFVELEWTTALALKVAVFPIQLDGTRLPAILSGIHAFSGADLGATALQIRRGLGSLPPRDSSAGSDAVIEGLNSIDSQDPREVLHAASAIFRQHNWTVQGPVYHAGGDIHVVIGGAPGGSTKSWPEKWQLWVGLIVTLLTALTLGKQLLQTSRRESEPPPLEDVAALKSGAVRLESGGIFMGAGLFINTSGLVLTTAYLAERLSKDGIQTKLTSGSRLPTRVATIDRARDVAVLNTEVTGQVTALKLSRETVSQDDDVIAVVQSTDEEWLTIRGKVSRVGVDTPMGKGRIEVNIPESLGSPVMNKRGEVIGVMQGSWKDRPGYSFLIPASIIQARLDEGLSAPQPEKTGSQPAPAPAVLDTGRAATAEAARPLTVIVMDSPLPAVVYKRQTREAGGTNADDISEVIDDVIPVGNIQKENTSLRWNREDAVVGRQPALVIIHASAFYDRTNVADQEKKFSSFITYVGSKTQSNFIVYSRGFCDRDTGTFDADRWKGRYAARYSALAGRILPLGVCSSGTWDDPATQRSLKRMVQESIGQR